MSNQMPVQPPARATWVLPVVIVVIVLGVVGVIGLLLLALLLPAVMQVRESARRVQCQNNLKQIGLAVMHHSETQGFFPTGGWGWGWAGDPDRGCDRRQPAGWSYNILPYLEGMSVHDLGAGRPEAQKRADGRMAAEAPLAMYYCPTRRRPIAYPYIQTTAYANIDRPTVVGRTDYAICAGDQAPDTIDFGPKTLADGDRPDYDWGAAAKTSNGVSYLRSTVTPGQVSDGMSCTYLIGERYLNPDDYLTGAAPDDDQGWNVGFEFDTHRWASEKLTPMQDKRGARNPQRFGSAHSSGWNMVFCDGSVRTISYSMDPATHRNLGVRNDHNAIDSSKF